jgi:hypothetical protein
MSSEGLSSCLFLNPQGEMGPSSVLCYQAKFTLKIHSHVALNVYNLNDHTDLKYDSRRSYKGFITYSVLLFNHWTEQTAVNETSRQYSC